MKREGWAVFVALEGWVPSCHFRTRSDWVREALNEVERCLFEESIVPTREEWAEYIEEVRAADAALARIGR